MVAISAPSNNTTSKNSKEAGFLKFGCSCSKHWHIILNSQNKSQDLSHGFEFATRVLKSPLKLPIYPSFHVLSSISALRTEPRCLSCVNPHLANIYKPSMGPLDRKVQWRSVEGRLLRNDRALMTSFLYHKVT